MICHDLTGFLELKSEKINNMNAMKKNIFTLTLSSNTNVLELNINLEMFPLQLSSAERGKRY